MAQDVNWTSQEWCDIVFEGKNKEYGAYTIRRTTSKRHTIAMIAVLLVAICVAVLPVIVAKAKDFANRIPGFNPDAKVEVTNLKPDAIDDEIPEPEPIQQELPPDLISSIKFTTPEIGDVNPNDTLMSVKDILETKVTISTANIQGKVDGTIDIRDLNINSTIAGDGKEEIYTIVEQNPEFPGGMAEFYEFLRNKLVYPPPAREAGAEGTATIKFVVNKDGSIGGVTVARSSGYKLLDDEAVRVVRMMPKWVAGKINGKSVSSWFQIPVRFQMNQ